MKTIIHISLAVIFLTACKKEVEQHPVTQCNSETVENVPGTNARYSFAFENGTRGWEIEGAAVLKYMTAMGNPLPCIMGSDKKTSGSWYFKAPAVIIRAITQNKSYDHVVTFDLLARSSGNTKEPDVILEGYGHKLVCDMPNDPTNMTWTTYSVRFNENAGWRIETLDGALATKADIKHMLLNLDKLLIRGKFSNAPDFGYLDNVTIE